MSEWRALPWRVRRDVIRLAVDGRPHPDPAVARAAVVWARPRRRLIPLLSIPFPIVPIVMLSALPRVFLPIAMVLLLVNLAVIIVGTALFIHAPKVEVANLRALLPVDRVEPVTVHGRGRFGIPDLVGAAGLLAVAAATVGLRRPPEEPPPDLPPGAVSLDLAFGVCVVVTLIVPLVVLVGLLLTMILVWPRSAGPLVIVDRAGVTVPHLRLTLPWNDVEWVDLAYPRPRGRLSAAIGLWIVPRDRRGITANARPVWWRRVPLAIWLMLCRRALFVPANWMREPPEVVVGAAVALLRDHRERAATQPA